MILDSFWFQMMIGYWVIGKKGVESLRSRPLYLKECGSGVLLKYIMNECFEGNDFPTTGPESSDEVEGQKGGRN